MPAAPTAEVVRLEAALEGWRLTGPGGLVQADICPAAGAEVSGLRLGTMGEVLYRANQFEPPPEGQWRGRAPLLWPAVGRNFTPAAIATGDPACGFDHGGQHYPLPIHGFARDLAWDVLGHGADSDSGWMRCGITDTAETRAVYPWPFTVEVEHRVDAQGLNSTVSITSSDELPFCIGNHLTVIVPGDQFESTTIEANVSIQHLLTDFALLSGESLPADLSQPQPLSDERWLNTVLGGIGGPARMTVRWPDGSSLQVGQDVVEGESLVDPADWLFVLYGNRELGYFCPEPWIGRPNGLQDPTGRVTLPAGGTFAWRLSLRMGA